MIDQGLGTYVPHSKLNYVQCKLECPIEEGSPVKRITVTWIPERHAFINKIVDLKCNDGTWDKGWIVKEVWSKKSAGIVIARERSYTKQRKVSDK